MKGVIFFLVLETQVDFQATSDKEVEIIVGRHLGG